MKGKILGGILGAMLGGPWGAIIGAAAGHFAIDGTERKNAEFARFLELVCMAIAKMAKVDGAITQAEIDETEAIFRDLKLDADARMCAIEAFRKSKKTNLTAADIAREFAGEFASAHWRNIFMAALCRVAVSDGTLADAELAQLREIARVLKLDLADYISGGGAHSGGSSAAQPFGLDEAYAILGVPRNASDDEIRKVYRAKCKELHPDLLRSRGIGETAVKVLEQELARLNDAYNTIKKHRN